MEKKTTKRISVLAALLLVFTMLFTAIVFSTVGKTRAFADGEGNVLLYIVDTGRVNDQYGDQLQYGYDPAEKTPTYVDSTKTFIKREGGTFGDITEYNGNPLTRLCNSYTDHPYGEDPTGKYWGFNEDYTEDMPHRLGRGGDYSGGFSEFRSVNDDEVTTERLIYKFEVPNGNALDVTVITCAPAGWGTVNGKMSVNGGEAIPLVAQEGKSYEERHSIEGCTGVLNNEDSRYYLTLTFGEEGAKTVICGIIIRTAPDNYNVSYNLDGGTNNAANKATYTYGEGLTLADPTREGYAFGGWYDKETGGNKVTAISVTQWGDVTLYARWNAIYAITYNLNGGINNAANTATYTQSIGLTLADPTRTGYTFVGWYDEAEGGNKVTAISDSQTGDVTLYARWNVATYTVTYNLDGGANDPANKTSYTYGEGFTLAEPTRTNYTFDGWYDADGNKVTAISDSQTGNVTLYARWNAVTFTVTYNLDGGTNNAANTATYTYGEGLTLANPTREGYTFDGWYDAENGGNKVTAIPDTQTGNVTLYARWTKNATEDNTSKDNAAKSGCNSSIGGTLSLVGGLLLLSAGAVVILKCKKKN